MQFGTEAHSTGSGGCARAELRGLGLAILFGVAVATLVLSATPAVALGSGDLGAEPKPPDSSNSCRGNGRNACPAPASPASGPTSGIDAALPAEPPPAAAVERGADLRTVAPVTNAERSLTILMVLGAAALLFLALQGRLDRRDPKLAGRSPDVRDDPMRFR